MSNTSYSLYQFFSPSGDEHIQPYLYLSELEACETISKIRRILGRKAKKLPWGTAFSTITSKIPRLLEIDLLAILLRAWEISAKVSEYLEKSAATPAETFLVHLAEHTLRSSHEPYLEILVNGKPIGRIRAEVSLELVVEGAILKIEAGEIRELRTAACKGKGTFCLEGIPIIEEESKTIQLPGVIRFDDRGKPDLKTRPLKHRKLEEPPVMTISRVSFR